MAIYWSELLNEMNRVQTNKCSSKVGMAGGSDEMAAFLRTDKCIEYPVWVSLFYELVDGGTACGIVDA